MHTNFQLITGSVDKYVSVWTPNWRKYNVKKREFTKFKTKEIIEQHRENERGISNKMYGSTLGFMC